MSSTREKKYRELTTTPLGERREKCHQELECVLINGDKKKYLGIFVYLVEQTKHNKMEVLTNPENCKLMSYWLSPYLIRA
jgi:hypothetical protein